jgi:16S rRNA processing protein RimM
MKKTETAYITVGKIGSTFGVQGWLKVQTFTEFGTNILDYKPWYLTDDEKEYQATIIEDGLTQGGQIIVKFTGYNTPEDARVLTNKLISVTREQLPPLQKNEYYWSDLNGLTVINKKGEILGKVIYLMQTGANDVLVIQGTKEHAIPYLPGDVITCVDLAKQEIHVDWELI